MKPSIQRYDSGSLWVRVVRSVLAFPADVPAIVGYVVLLHVLIVEVGGVPVSLRVLLALPFVFLLPGYGLVSVLFPRRNDDDTGGLVPHLRYWSTLRGDGIGWRDRMALSFGVSLVLLPPLGLALAASRYGFTTAAVTNTLALVILAGVIAGGFRRAWLPVDRRFEVPLRRWRSEFHDATIGNESSLDAIFNVVLAGLVVLSIASLGYALAIPASSWGATDSTEFYLLQENADGQLVSTGFPDEFSQGEAREMYVGIENREGKGVTYTVAVELQRVRTDGGEVTVLEQEQLDRFSSAVEAGETVRERRSVTPNMVGSDLRLVYTLYKGDAPQDPSTETADRSVFVWVDVEP